MSEVPLVPGGHRAGDEADGERQALPLLPP